MKRYFIEEAKCGISDGGMACSPMDGNVVASVKFRTEDETGWFNMVEVMGIPNCYVTDRDVYEGFIKEPDDEKFWEYVQEHFITEFNGIEFDDSYFTPYASIADDPENPANPLVRYLITLVRCDMEDVEGLIDMAHGKYADELDIPTNDMEEEYLEELEEEE